MSQSNAPKVAEVDHISPLRVRLVVFAVMGVVALGAIGLIDRRAMERQDELESEYAAERAENGTEGGEGDVAASDGVGSTSASAEEPAERDADRGSGAE